MAWAFPLLPIWRCFPPLEIAGGFTKTTIGLMVFQIEIDDGHILKRNVILKSLNPPASEM